MCLVPKKPVRMPLAHSCRETLARKRARIESEYLEHLPLIAFLVLGPEESPRREEEALYNDRLFRFSGLKTAMAFKVRLNDEEMVALGKLQRKLHIVSENPAGVPPEKYLRTFVKGLRSVVRYGAEKMGIRKEFAIGILTKLENSLASN